MPIQPNPNAQRALQIVNLAAQLASLHSAFAIGTPAQSAQGPRPAISAQTAEEFRALLVSMSDENTVNRIESAVAALSNP
jgi:hypothetical protein